MTPIIHKLYFDPRIDVSNANGKIGGVKAYIDPAFAKPDDWHIIYNAPARARLMSVIMRFPCKVNGEPMIASQIAPFDFTNVTALETGTTCPEGAELAFNEARQWVDAPQWVTCALNLAEGWHRPLFEKKALFGIILKQPDIFLNPMAMTELVERTDPARQAIVLDLSICLLWDVWHRKELTLDQAAEMLRLLTIHPNINGEALRQRLKRLGLPAIKGERTV
jgi:hypothetical protein